ncbi:hypothetical protein EAH87_04280 [Sphingomonas koreensis]|nr:hypothetical protein EAH87_04280 [Sphingomonas koreensis]
MAHFHTVDEQEDVFSTHFLVGSAQLTFEQLAELCNNRRRDLSAPCSKLALEDGDVGLGAGSQGNIAAARSDVAAADARVTAATNEAAATIANARASLAAAEARVGALEQSGLAEAREALRLAELSYRAGKASLIELLDAQQAYALTQSDLIAARQARAEAAATLAREASAQ